MKIYQLTQFKKDNLKLFLTSPDEKESSAWLWHGLPDEIRNNLGWIAKYWTIYYKTNPIHLKPHNFKIKEITSKDIQYLRRLSGVSLSDPFLEAPDNKEFIE